MATIQESIDVQVPVHTLYRQLTKFEDYPRFLENVERVERTDLTHLHWIARSADQPIEWDAEITEREDARLIAWHNTNGAGSAGKIEMQELGAGVSRVVFTVETEHGEPSGLTAGGTEEEMSQHLTQNLLRLKELLEARGPQAKEWRAEIRLGDADVDELDAQTQADIMNQVRQTEGRRSPASVSGSPTEVLEDEPNEAGPAGFKGPNAANENPPGAR
ncbi:SRPBCC family protein [Oxalobacteraceae bacterium R-40]|uniref:SRPBCC family protein n=1 Tax=Keguizhuia sedimenti TaxID=3064264 RepID=A0ABU1BPQ6_9BURK|nr:SRPBCC family protein [Oxalobacteraceae bacterium R-40]